MKRLVGLMLVAFFAIMALASRTQATGGGECPSKCTPSVNAKFPEFAVVGEESTITLSVTSSKKSDNSYVIDCYWGGGNPDGHLAWNNITVQADAKPKVLSAGWEPWEPGLHTCTVRIYRNPGGCWQRNSERTYQVWVVDASCVQ